MTVDEALQQGQIALLEGALRRVCFEATQGGAAGSQAQQVLQNFKQNLLSAGRKSALSAMFFEADARQLAASVDGYLRSAPAAAPTQPCPKIIIAPACRAYLQWRDGGQSLCTACRSSQQHSPHRHVRPGTPRVFQRHRPARRRQL